MPSSPWYATAGIHASQLKVGDLLMYGLDLHRIDSIAEQGGRLVFDLGNGVTVRHGHLAWVPARVRKTST